MGERREHERAAGHAARNKVDIADMAIIRGRQQAYPDRPFALFLIGMRINNLLAVNRWWPVAWRCAARQAPSHWFVCWIGPERRWNRPE